MIDTLRRFFWLLPRPVRKPLLWVRKLVIPSAYRRWLQSEYPAIIANKDKLAASPLPPNAPSISLITLVYNPQLRHFKQCVESVLRQTYKNFEWIIVLNAASKPLRNYLAQINDNRIKTFCPQCNVGIAMGTRLAVEQASRQWLAFLDHDDFLEPTALEAVAKAAAFKPEIEFIYTDNDHCDEVGRKHTPMLKPGPSPEYLTAINYICHFHAVKRESFFAWEPSGKETEGSQDWDLSLKALDVPSRVWHIPQILYTVRHHPGRFSLAAFHSDNSSAAIAIRKAQVCCLEGYLRRKGAQSAYKPSFRGGCYRFQFFGKVLPSVTVFSKEPCEFYPGARVRSCQSLNELVAGELQELSTPFVAWVNPQVEIQTNDWLVQAVGMLSREPSVAMVAGFISGVEGPPLCVPGSYGLCARREVSSLPGLWWVGRADVLKKILRPQVDWQTEFCSQVLENGYRLIFDPHLRAALISSSSDSVRCNTSSCNERHA
ncbi:MAG: glycosyltransferase [Deltaproteobacteria bacterium]|nr:glycosyltransferase [Deltaproteobacteria bacterium]